MTEDLGIYFADFGIEITLHLEFEDRTVDALFFDPKKERYKLDQINSGDPITVLIKTADAVDLVRKKNTATINGAEYGILDIIPDGTGLTKLYVEENVNAG